MGNVGVYLIVGLIVVFAIVVFSFWLLSEIKKDKKIHSGGVSGISFMDRIDRIFASPIDNRPKLPRGYDAPWLSRSSYRR